MECSSQSPFNPVSINNHSSLTNSTADAEITALVYMVEPADFDAKQIILAVLFVVVGVIGLVGNILILYFLSKKESVPFLQSSPFLRNFYFYMKSLALSYIPTCLISVPLVSIQIIFHEFQNGWPCRVVRFVNVAFNCISLNNLIVINTERFLSTRDVPKTFSCSTVRKLVYAAWLSGFLIGLLTAATTSGIRHDVNATHYTVVCKPDISYLPYRIIVTGVTLIQLAIPITALIFINIILARRAWKMGKRRIDIQQDNLLRATMRSHQIKITYTLVFVTLAFVVPYLSILSYLVFTVVAKFQGDFVIRHFSWVVLYSSGALNFMVHLVQMKAFRVFLMKRFCSKCGENA